MVTVADIVRGEQTRYLETWFATPVQRKAMYDITCCRTAAMGIVAQWCDQCEEEYWLYRSCGNRSCPSCGGEARRKWVEARGQEILPVEYLQVIFTPPSELKVLAWYCPEAVYDAVIRAAGQAVIDVGRSSLHAQLGAQVHLQTWAQSMAFHLHTHCVVPCGGFSEDGSQWISFPPSDLPRKALRSRFRTLVCEGIRAAAAQGKLAGLPDTVSVEHLLAMLKNRQWRVYAERPRGGVQTLLAYLARYTYRVAITNDRISSYEDDQVTFLCRSYRRNEEKPLTLDGVEFVRRFLRHVPPKGFVRVRSYGFLGNRNRKTNLAQARRLIGPGQPTVPSPESVRPLRLCPPCFARMGTGRRPAFAPTQAVASQLPFNLRPPPIYPVAA